MTPLAKTPRTQSALTPERERQIAYVARERGKLLLAGEQEARETLADLAKACGGTMPERLSFTAEHITSLVKSAFNAGALYEAERRDGKLSGRA